jgi:mannitol/fructose-specific phosphotransferase system IIA component (Ntr-type)/cellobiose-specific phosphotransferase system component IIB
MKNPIKKMDVELYESDELCINIAKEIITIAERVYNHNFKDDEDFYKGLLIHLRPTINRLIFGLSFNNPLLQEIKTTYPKAYGIAFMSSEAFEKYNGKPIPEEEIAYIAIHIEAAAERRSNSLNTVVVCSTGMGTAELLATKIQKRFKQINIVSVDSFSAFSTSDMTDIDLVLSTVPIKSKVPHLLVSPLLTVSDVNSIFNFIEKGDTYENQLHNFINNSFVYKYNNCKNKEEVIHRVYIECKNQGYVTSEYYIGVIKREKSYSTEIGKGVAVPHSPLEFVKKSVMVLVKLDKPIKWDTTMVDVVLFIALSKADSYQLTDLLKNIYSCFDNDTFLEELRAENDMKKIKEILYEKCIEI